MQQRKLRRTRGKEAALLGVCGGIAQFFGIDATLVRIIWAVSVIFFGTGLLLYLIMAFVMPKA